MDYIWEVLETPNSSHEGILALLISSVVGLAVIIERLAARLSRKSSNGNAKPSGNGQFKCPMLAEQLSFAEAIGAAIIKGLGEQMTKSASTLDVLRHNQENFLKGLETTQKEIVEAMHAQSITLNTMGIILNGRTKWFDDYDREMKAIRERVEEMYLRPGGRPR